MDCPESYDFTESYETQLRHLGSNGEKGLPHPFGEIKLTKGSVLWLAGDIRTASQNRAYWSALKIGVA